VEEFRVAVGEKPAYVLQQSLKIHHRCQPSSTSEQKQAAIGMVYLLTTLFSQFNDWRDLVKEREQSDMETLLSSELASDIEQKAISNMPQSSAPLLPPPSLYFDRSVKKLLKMFPNTDPDKGLPSDVVPLLREQYGSNKLPEPPKPSALKMIWAQLTDFMVIILIIACIIEAGEQEFNSMAVLLVVIVLNTVIGFTQEWKASKTLEALMHLSTPQVNIIFLAICICPKTEKDRITYHTFFSGYRYP
jgi:Ca2+-transporting ATPase